MINKRVILLGAGNVAHHLAPALLKAGINLCQIYSRTLESARELGVKTGIAYTTEISSIYPDGDVYIFCVSDSALLTLYKRIRINKDALIIHTSGSLSIDIFKPFTMHAAVLYPLQTFTKKRDLNFKEIPLCIEAMTKEGLEEVRELAQLLSLQVEEVVSDKRKILHLAAVFANNFVNHLYTIAGHILEKESLDFNLLRPLIFETAHKVMLMPPEDAQTGPARRGDENILNMHKNLLKEDPQLWNLYVQLSESIQEKKQKIQGTKVEQDDKSMMLTLW